MTGPEQTHLDYLQELMAKQEELDPELARWLDDDGPFGPCIKHPMVYAIAHPPQMNAFVNEQLRRKKQAVREAKAEGNWHRYIYLYERPYRVHAFMDICWHLDASRYWELLGDVWTDTENCWQNMENWREVLEADPGGREMMSTEKVRDVFTLSPKDGGLLPQTVVYRGYCFDEALDGYSWTLDKARARWFATRLRQDDHPPAKIAKGLVAREHVIAYITSRDEAEIVTLPEHVTDIEIEEI